MGVERGRLEIEVDRSPINCMAASWRDSQARGVGDRLVIGPNRGYFLVACGFLAFGLSCAVIGATEWSRGGASASAPLLIGCGSMAVGAAMVALRRRFIFDRAAGTLWMRPGLRARRVGLDEVLAVQVICGGTHAASHGVAFSTHQLNLVLGGERRERVNVSNQPDRGWAAATGEQLAEFLGVPFLGPTQGGQTGADKA